MSGKIKKGINLSGRVSTLFDINVKGILKYTPLQKPKSKHLVEIIAEERGIVPDRVIYLFALYLSRLLRLRIQESVKHQKLGNKPMKQIYKPLSPAYKKTKKWGTKNKFWVNTGWLIENIHVWRQGHDIWVGYGNKVRHPETKAKAQNIIIWLEKGTKNIPARPLFTPNFVYVRKNIGRFFKKFVKMCDENKCW